MPQRSVLVRACFLTAGVALSACAPPALHSLPPRPGREVPAPDLFSPTGIEGGNLATGWGFVMYGSAPGLGSLPLSC